MQKLLAPILLFICSIISQPLYSNDLTRSVDAYIREKYMPAKKYKWRWTRAPLLRAMIVEYENASEPDKKIFLDYIREAMDRNMRRVRGNTPNAVASAHGMAFLAKVTGEEKYKKAALQVFDEYMKIKRTPDNGVTHKAKFLELWDDTVYMIGVYLLEMYRWTGDEKYLEELAVQVRVHREHLKTESGLWVHGYDADGKNRCNFCGQTGWSKNPEKRSGEVWGRGNGWVVVTLSDAVKTIPKANPLYTEFSGYLKEMISGLPALQDSATGHWFQLPLRKNEPGNYIESSATTMFSYGIKTAIEQNIISGKEYENAIQQAYQGLQKYSVVRISNEYSTIKNVCQGTCIGDKGYYFNRKTKSDSPYGLGLLLLLGRAMD
jgi:unsaturated rhamnogalacturonyl hydrolase